MRFFLLFTFSIVHCSFGFISSLPSYSDILGRYKGAWKAASEFLVETNLL